MQPDPSGQEMRQVSKKYQASNYPSIWPVNGTITSNFGYRGNPIGGGTGYHEGLDIAVDYGTPVRATASGKSAMPLHNSSDHLF